MSLHFKTIVLFLLPMLAFAAEEAERHGPNFSGLLWRVFVFVLFVGLLYYLLSRRVKDGLAESAENVKKTIEEAENACKNAEKELAEYAEKINSMTKELDDMKIAAKKSAETEKARILTEAERSVSKYRETAKAMIEGEFAKAAAELKSEISLAAIEQAEKDIAQNAETLAGQKYTAKAVSKIGV